VFCALKGIGTLRSVSSASQCSKFENAVVVTPTNRQPDAVDDSIGVMEDIVSMLNVLANDTDPDGDTLTITAIGAGSDATPTIAAGGTAISYDDASGGSQGEAVDDSPWTYTISDGHGGSDTATVNVRIWGGPDYSARCVPLTLSSGTVAPGGTVTVSGTAATGGSSLDVLFNGTVLKSITSGSSPFTTGAPIGPFSTQITIPPNTPTGSGTIQVVQKLSYTQPEGCPSQSATIDVQP
jgi:hypothetical protein